MITNDKHINEHTEPGHEPLDETITVTTIDFPYTMPAPNFGDSSSDMSGTVLHISDFQPGPENQVVLKGAGEDLVQLITESPLTETGILTGAETPCAPELLGFHYYYFDDDMKLYSDQALTILTG